jgi:alpha-D-xyloside xylohydrolase
MRTHGTRHANEVWSYGPEAQPILEKYLKLRYALMPYIYSLGWFTHRTGAPFMRALFMDFGNDPKVADIRDEYMFGPALLVAPVVEQGATTREVYLPAGTDWYNYWTNEKLAGGQTVTVAAPIGTIPLFVSAGSIIPLGSDIQNTSMRQTLKEIRVYPGRGSEFTLYDDDGVSYDYEKGQGHSTRLHWDDDRGRLTSTGAPVVGTTIAELTKVVR